MADHVLDEAARLCASLGLGAYDGVQLSSALAGRSADHTCLTFAVLDEALRVAGAAEGFTVVPAGDADGGSSPRDGTGS
jgi:hypothetical protein